MSEILVMLEKNNQKSKRIKDISKVDMIAKQGDIISNNINHIDKINEDTSKNILSN